ncbi:MAG: lipase family protein [Gammaproteobacteria bacterium]|jgi:triacylglycerol lipase
MNSVLPAVICYREIYRYAELSKAAYLDFPELKREFGNTVSITELDSSRVRVVLINHERSDIQWVAIRGTANPRNVVVDGKVKILREPRLGVYLHGGFLRAAQEAFDAIKPNLDLGRQIRITGHSLGGAVALILAALLSEDGAGFQLGRTITFGQPMVTDSNGVKVLKKYPLLRVVNRWDPVAILPLILSRTHFELRPTVFYHHVGPQLTLYRDREPKYSEPGRLITLVLGYKWLIKNHFMDLYLQRLNTLLASDPDN